MSLSPLNPFVQFLSTHNQAGKTASIVSTALPEAFSATARSSFDILRIGQPAPEPLPEPEPTPSWLRREGANGSSTVQVLAYEFVSSDGTDDALEIVLNLADYFAGTWNLEPDFQQAASSTEAGHE